MRTLNRLNDKQVAAFLKPKALGYAAVPAVMPKTRMLADGGGLFLVVRGGSATWQYKYMFRRRSRSMGLGPYPDVSLALARERAAAYRTQHKRDRVDPLDVLRATERERVSSAARTMTFKEAVAGYLKDHSKRWTDPKAVRDWQASLRWAEKFVGAVDVAGIDRQLVLKVLSQDVNGEPLWTAKPVQAKRIRARMEAVLEWAAQHDLRAEGPNPAEWSRIKAALPAHGRIHEVKHHEHVPVDAVPAFMASLRDYQVGAEARRAEAALAVVPTKGRTVRALVKAENDALAAQALEFMVLTATRTGDVVGLTWAELDLDAKRWVLPIDRYKTRRRRVNDIRIPLCSRALAILTGLRSNHDPKAPVFPFSNRNKAMYNVLRELHPTADPHGLARASFRTWCADTGVPFEVAEAAEGHVTGNAVVQAYQHSDLYEARVPLMEAWAAYCASTVAPAA